MHTEGQITNMEKALNEILPFTIKFTIYLGIVLILIGITLMIYNQIFSLNKANEFHFTLIKSGVSILPLGFLFDFMLNYDIEYSSFTISIPCGYFIFLVIFFCLLYTQKKESKTENEDIEN